MTKIKLLCCLLVCTLPAALFGQTYNLYWDKIYGGSNREWNTQVVKGADGSIFLIGDSQTDQSGNKAVGKCAAATIDADIWLLKVDTAGGIKWQKNFGGAADERYPQLVPLNNAKKELLFACQSASDIACDKTEPNRDTIPIISTDYWICLLDSNGNKVWDKTLGGDNYDDNTHITVLSNGDILVCGQSKSDVSGDKTVPQYSISNDLWAVKLDNLGNIIWDKVYGGTGAEFLSSMIPMAGGDCMLVGTTSSDQGGDVTEPNQGIQDFWMIRIDNNGNPVYDKRLGGDDVDKCYSATRTSDGGFILCGYTVSQASGDVTQSPKGVSDYWIVKTDSAGNKQWDKRFGGNQSAFGTYATEAVFGGYWVLGYTNSVNTGDVTQPPYGGSDYWTLLLDTAGAKLWDKRFGGPFNEYSSNLIELADSSLLLFGYADTGTSPVKTVYGYGALDYWAVKVKYIPLGVGFDEVPNTVSMLSVHPNPTAGNTTLSYEYHQSGLITLKVTDIAGKLVYEDQIQGNYGSNQHLIDFGFLNKGIYLLTLSAEGTQLGSNKLVIE